LKIAKAALAAGTAILVFLCVRGLKPASVGIPLVLADISFLFAAGSAALFARAARRSLEDADPDTDDDDRGPGGGGDNPPAPTGGGGIEFEWEQFERDFRSYAERARSVLLS
jgi:hypothetical protein